MPAFVGLGQFTEQGMRDIKHLARLRQAAEQDVASPGGRVVANSTTFGPYDVVVIVEVPRAEDAPEGAFTSGSQG